MKIYIFCILKATEDFCTDLNRIRSVSQRYGSEDPHPDPYQNVADPERGGGVEVDIGRCNFLLLTS
jgi:hypothetical protein